MTVRRIHPEASSRRGPERRDETTGRGTQGGPGTASVRLAAVAGVAFFVLTVVQGNLRSGSPTATDTGREVLAYVEEHTGRLQLGAVLLGFAMSAALLWLSGLFRLLRAAEGGTPALAIAALAGGVLAAASTVTGALLLGTIAARVDDLGPDAARVWWTMFVLSSGATLLGLLLLIGATAAVHLQTGLFGRRFGVVSVVLALLSAVAAGAIAYPGDAIQTVAGIAVLLDSAWILGVSIGLWREPDRALP